MDWKGLFQLLNFCRKTKVDKMMGRCNSKLKPLLTSFRMKSVLAQCKQFFFYDNLLLTNSITSGVFMSVGDLVIQEYEFRYGMMQERYDWIRALRMLLVGTTLGPVHHYYYLKLDQLIPKVNLKTTLIKIAADQTFCAPLTIFLFLSGMGILEAKDLQGIKDEIRNKSVTIYMGDILFWPPVQFINFYYLPSAYRVFYINLATLIFDVYLAYVKHYEPPKETADVSPELNMRDTNEAMNKKLYDSSTIKMKKDESASKVEATKSEINTNIGASGDKASAQEKINDNKASKAEINSNTSAIINDSTEAKSEDTSEMSTTINDSLSRKSKVNSEVSTTINDGLSRKSEINSDVSATNNESVSPKSEINTATINESIVPKSDVNK